MGLALVPRGVRALSEQLNAYFRVLRGVDPDSVYLRLNSGGSFEVRHSATNAAVFSVTDGGASLVVDTGDLADGAVTSAKIADGTIVDADISGSAAINGGKIAGGTISGGAGGQIAASTIASSNIADGTIVDADISGSAAINGGKIAGGTISGGAGGQIAASTITTSNIVDGTIVNADVSPSAAVAYTKLALTNAIVNGDVNTAAAIDLTKLQHVGGSNVLKSNGTQNIGGQVQNADVSPSAAIAYTKLALTNAIVNADVNTAAAIAYTKLALTNAIVNGDINTAAAIALSKLAPGPSGVLKSNGVTITAGNTITSADIADNTILDADINAAANIDGSKLADGTVSSAKLSGGVSIPANSVTTAEIAQQTIQGGMAGASSDIAFGTITGGQAGGNSNIAASTIIGSGSGGTSNILAGSIARADIAAGQIPTLLATSGYLSSSSGAVVFSSITQLYTSLELRISGRSTIGAASDTVRLTINGDVGTTYWNQALYGSGGTAGAYEGFVASAEIGVVPGASAVANHTGSVVAQLPGYNRSGLFKIVQSTSYVSWDISASAHQSQAKGTTWLSAAAITSLSVFPSGTSWLAGSIVSLYGWP